MGGGTGRARHPIFPGLPGKLLLHTAPHCSQPWETHCSLTPRCADTAPRSETRYCILGQSLSLLPGLSPGCPLLLGYYGCPLLKGTSPSLLCVAPTKGATALGAPTMVAGHNLRSADRGTTRHSGFRHSQSCHQAQKYQVFYFFLLGRGKKTHILQSG